MEILPEAFTQCLAVFRPLLRVEVYLTFTYLVTGLLVGEAKWGAVCASVFAPAAYQPARTSDFFTTQRVSPQRLMAALAALVLRLVVRSGLAHALVLAGRPYDHREAFRGQGRGRALVSSHEACRRPRAKSQRPLLCLRGVVVRAPGCPRARAMGAR